MIHLYYGNGKGKTTAAMGLALRCAGNGGRVKIVQFLKDNSSSERNILDKIDGIDIVKVKDSEKFVFNMTDEEKTQAMEYYSQTLNEAFADAAKYDMLVLDEVMVAVEYELIDEKQLLKLLVNPDAEIVMTGGNPSERILEVCDYVTQMRKVKHPFDKGIVARKGVEF